MLPTALGFAKDKRVTRHYPMLAESSWSILQKGNGRKLITYFLTNFIDLFIQVNSWSFRRKPFDYFLCLLHNGISIKIKTCCSSKTVCRIILESKWFVDLMKVWQDLLKLIRLDWTVHQYKVKENGVDLRRSSDMI